MNSSKFLFLLILLSFIACDKGSSKKEKTESVKVLRPDTVTENNEKSKVKKPVEIKKESESNQQNSNLELSVDCTYPQKMAEQGLVNISEIDPSILVQLKYSTTDNFTGKDVYGCLSDCYLQKKAAEMLANASKYLQLENDSLRLLVYDGARPHSIQVILWESLPQYTPAKRRTFVADPAEGSIHNYGSAVDLTIAFADGTPLDMGTKYDYFGELAYPKFENRFLQNGKLSKNQLENRQLLRKVMQKAGFMPIEYEWWHFNAVSRAKAKAMYQIVE